MFWIMKQTINFNTNILSWAIARAGYSLPEFIEKVPQVEAWIENSKQPTLKQLENLSKKLFIPLGYFFLNAPPEEELPIPYFRNNQSSTGTISANVYDTIQLMLQRQNWLRDYLINNEFDRLSFVGAYRNVENVDLIVNHIRETLNLKEGWANHCKTWQEALAYLVERVEDSGIVTVFNGVVENNTHRKIDVQECRGFVLVDEYAPLMFVNNADSKSAQMFTIVHELAHIWTGHSAGFDFRKLQPANDPIEHLCDRVAAEFLVPTNAFLEHWETTHDYPKLARIFKVSEIVIARRALDLGKINLNAFFRFYEDYKNREWQRKKNSASSGGNFYATAKKRLSVTFASHINSAVKSGQLLYRDAYRLTGMKGDTFKTFYTEYF